MNIPLIPAKSIVRSTQSPDMWFGVDYNMNIYRGCSHGCIYCDSRSDCFKEQDFDTVKVKDKALEIVRDELRRKVKTGVIGTGAMSDPYNPLEQELKLTRNTLELINAFGFGVSLITKSDLIARDADVLTDIKNQSPVITKFSITTADDYLCKKIEPYVAPSSLRFKAMANLAERGIFTGTMIVPLLPYINDTDDNIKNICHMTKETGGRFVYTYMGMTLRQGSREYFYHQLDNVLPGVKEKYMKRYGLRYNCTSTRSKKLWDVFANECERLGLMYDMKAIIHAYKSGYGTQQLTLF